MENLEIKLIPNKNIEIILPLLSELNGTIDENTLRKRVLEMATQHYRCVGVFINDNLIGISGLWFLTRHYCGKVIEPDNVIINGAFRNK